MHLGPYKIYFWNIIVMAVLFFVAFILRQVIEAFIKRYLSEANIRVDGKRATYLRLFSQSVFAVAGFLSILSLQLNPENKLVTFQKFLDYKFISTSKFNVSFENVILLIMVIFGAKVTLNIIKLWIQRRAKRTQIDTGTQYVYAQLAKYVIYVFAFILALIAMDVKPTIFLGGSAALLVGLGLGLQDVFKDMFSGFVLLFEGSIRVGDVIEIYDGKSSEAIVAKVLKINIRTTQIETREGNILIVPNTKLTQEYIENWSHGSTLSRFRIHVTVHYGTDTQLVSDLLTKAAAAHPNVKKTEPIQVRLADFGENGLIMELIFWADQNWDINSYKSDIRFEIDRLFRENNIHIPYPQREMRIIHE